MSVVAGLAALLLVASGTTKTVLPVANLWVDMDGGRCTRAVSPVAYSDGAACQSLSAAYSAAQATSSGDTVRIKAGTYSAQTIPSGTKTLSFIGESKANVKFPSLTVQGSNVTVDSFSANTSASVRSLVIEGTAVTVANFNALNGAGIGGGAANVTLSHGNIGPSNSCNFAGEDGIQAYGAGSIWGAAPVNGLHIDGVTIHDLTGTDQCGEHVDGIQGAGGINWTIKNSHFYNTDTSAILVKDGTVQNITIQNNEFGTIPNPGNSLDLQNTNNTQLCSNIIVQNNTFYKAQPTFHETDGNCTNYFARNNYFVTGASPCNTGITSVNNVFQSGACGSNAKTCTVSWAAGGAPTDANADIAANDHCVGSAADPNNFVHTDIHGTPKWAPDASASAVTQRPSKTVLLAPRTTVHKCLVRGPLPDRACSPGAIYSDATPLVICLPGYASRMSTPSTKEKAAIYGEYGIPGTHYGRPYEIDHIVPVALGGSHDPANLFPEAGSNPSPGFLIKDALEKRLHELVCTGKRKLGKTQRAIARDWVSLYREVYGKKP